MSNEYVEDIIDNLYEQSIINKGKSEPSRKSIHVSDLTADCMRKAWYRMNGFKPDERDFDKTIPLVHGNALHDICNLGGQEHEMELFCNIKKMEKVDGNKEYGYDLKGLTGDCVKGSMDDLIEIDDELIICDKKTTKKSIPREVSDAYKEQLNIYKLLYFITKGVEISRGAIIYIDKSSGWSRHKTRVFDLDSIENIRKRVLSKLQVLDSHVAPDRVVTFLCPWCPHYKECNPSGY